MSQPNLFCNSGRDVLSDEACLEIARAYLCAPDEDDLTCERCGATTRELLNLPGAHEEVCRACFAANNGPERVRDEAARDWAEDQGTEDYMERARR